MDQDWTLESTRSVLPLFGLAWVRLPAETAGQRVDTAQEQTHFTTAAAGSGQTGAALRLHWKDQPSRQPTCGGLTEFWQLFHADSRTACSWRGWCPEFNCVVKLDCL